MKKKMVQIAIIGMMSMMLTVTVWGSSVTAGTTAIGDQENVLMARGGKGKGRFGSGSGAGDGMRRGGHGPGDGTGNGGNGPKDGTGNGSKTGDCVNS